MSKSEVLRISGASKANGDGESLLSLDAVFVDEWFHVGFAQLSPWMFSLMRVVSILLQIIYIVTTF